MTEREGYQGYQGFKVSRFYSAFCLWEKVTKVSMLQDFIHLFVPGGRLPRSPRFQGFKILFSFLPLGGRSPRFQSSVQDFIQIFASGGRLPRFQGFKTLFRFLPLWGPFKVSRFYSDFCPCGAKLAKLHSHNTLLLINKYMSATNK